VVTPRPDLLLGQDILRSGGKLTQENRPKESL
jgi:hypothetical protein